LEGEHGFQESAEKASGPIASDMGIHRIDELTERQKQCLRGIYANLSIKEIGQQLDLSPYTVNEHLRDARRVLRVSRSMAAARLLAAHEGDTRDVPMPNGVAAEAALTDTDTAGPIGLVRNRYNLSAFKRIGLTVAVAFSALAFVGALIVGADAINRVFVGYGIDISDPPYRK
jgi:DNA-binding CsgD family transcriptional regulator